MTKILVLSDSHGDVLNMVKAVETTQPDMIFHLGDCVKDAEELHAKYPDLTMVNVPGNCDCVSGDAVRIVEIEGTKILLCHGHTYHVKATLLSLTYAAKELGAEVALYGHTHVASNDYHNRVRLCNPGSIGAPRFMSPATCGVLFLDQETNFIRFEIISI